MKAKRFAESNDLDFYEDTKTVRRRISEEKITTDVRIVPENSQDNRRMSRYPNHRYDPMESEDKLYEKMMRDVYVENGWYPKPLKQKVKGGPLNNIQDIISRGRTSGEEGRKRAKLTNQFTSPIRLNGVYIRKTNDKVSNKNSENNDDYNYLKQINDLIESDSPDNNEEESWIPAYAFKSRGSPFRKPPKAANFPRQQGSHHGKGSNQMSKSELSNEKEASPITILLDFRSESETEDNETRNDGRKGNKFITKRKPKNEIIYIPINPRKAFRESMVGSETRFPANLKYLTNKNLDNMVIKLNLYPRKGKWKRQHPVSNFGKRLPAQTGERRTFGLFSKHKKEKNFKKCPIFDLKPQGHTIKAKWKNKNGDWIHSEKVVVNRFKDDWKR